MKEHNEIKIKWLYDVCQEYGYQTSGARVYLNDEVFLDLVPNASRTGYAHWEDCDVYEQIVNKLGYKVIELN